MKVYLIGCGMGTPSCLTMKAVEALRSSEAVIGPERLLAVAREVIGEGAGEGPGTMPLKSLEERQFIEARTYEEETLDILSGLDYGEESAVSVLFSGDVSFFSGSLDLLEHDYYRSVTGDSDERLKFFFIPGISSVQYFAAKLRENWNEWTLASTHGYLRGDVRKLVCGDRPVFVLTSGIKDALQILEDVLYGGLTGDYVSIGINLSYPDECIFSETIVDAYAKLKDISEEGRAVFRKFNEEELVWEEVTVSLKDPGKSLVVMLIRHYSYEYAYRAPGLSIPPGLLKEDRPVTKENIRALIVSKMQPGRDDFVLDIGAGSGAVSVELAMLARRVTAIEKGDVDTIYKLRNFFGARNLDIVKGEAPEALNKLKPMPVTMAFIGGSGGKFKEIVDWLNWRYPEALICYTAILIETLSEGVSHLEKLGYTTVIDQISSCRSVPVNGKHMMKAENPIYIVCAVPDKNRRRKENKNKDI